LATSRESGSQLTYLCCRWKASNCNGEGQDCEEESAEYVNQFEIIRLNAAANAMITQKILTKSTAFSVPMEIVRQMNLDNGEPTESIFGPTGQR